MASLVILDGTGQGSHFPLTQPITSVGRDDECTIQILDDQVSRRHLQIRFEPTTGVHYAGDYRSANGVFVNGRQIVIDVALNDGDRIRIGSTTLMYLKDTHADSASAMAAARKKDEWGRETVTRN
jgi:pSer/pThr/pTyr-binding forkhead associated (FHA) protein